LLRASEVAGKRLAQLAHALSGTRRLVILTHDNPDPDAIASGWALMRVARKIHRMRVDLAYGGIIGRGENRALLEVLRVPLRPLETLDLSTYDAVALVDCQPGTGNNALPAGHAPTVVFDHHPLRRLTRSVPFYDVREDYGATATIASEYALASDLRMDRRLATALFYAIKAETENLGREASRADMRAFLHFFPLVDNRALSSIEHPPVSRSYFSMISQAIEGTTLHGSVAVTRLGQVVNPDMVAEFADRMVRLEKIRWALAMGRYGSDLLVSIRSNLARAHAGRIIRQIVGTRGTAGGHGSMAGGKIEGGARTEDVAREGEERLRARTLHLLKAELIGEPLIERPPGPSTRAGKGGDPDQADSTG
jgi:nanoRNase/pAp phosphatase (c-di-AMP/oligoRNAs hydrolase)